MSLGIRADMEVAVRAGFVHILFTEPRAEDVQAVIAYLKSLQPVDQPAPQAGRFPNGIRAARREDLPPTRRSAAPTVIRPRSSPISRLSDVGTGRRRDRGAARFDTPSLIELWRTPPYLHDGSAATLRQVLIDDNRDDRHGMTSSLKHRGDRRPHRIPPFALTKTFHHEIPSTRRFRSFRLRHRLRRLGHRRRCRLGRFLRRCRVAPHHRRGARRRHQPARHRARLRLGPQRAPDRQSHRGPARLRAARHQMRPLVGRRARFLSSRSSTARTSIARCVRTPSPSRSNARCAISPPTGSISIRSIGPPSSRTRPRSRIPWPHC